MTSKQEPPAQPTEDEVAALASIDQIRTRTILVPILGTSPIITHRFSEKAKGTMLAAMQGKKTPKEPKNPRAEYEGAFYRSKDGDRYGMPVTAFHQATIGAARYYGKDVSMTALRQFIFMMGEVGADGEELAILNGEPVMREDVVRVGTKGTDLRYRPMFAEWSTELQVVFVTSALTQSSVLSLIDAGGLGVGVGEWRPEKKGTFGRYKVDPSRDIEVIEP